jgi:hypothetical protein
MLNQATLANIKAENNRQAVNNAFYIVFKLSGLMGLLFALAAIWNM